LSKRAYYKDQLLKLIKENKVLVWDIGKPVEYTDEFKKIKKKYNEEAT